MKQLCLTGPFGAGKSLAARLIIEACDEAGIATTRVDLDHVAHEVEDTDARVRDRLAKTFGAKILKPDGLIDRKKLATIAFKNAENTQKLNWIVHPATVARAQQMVHAASEHGILVILESPLPVRNWFPDATIWTVHAPVEERLRRVMGKGFSRSDARRRFARQPDPEVYQAEADLVIENAGGFKDLEDVVRDGLRI
ncbi:MAG: dephospho-CoA kinase [Actinomycetes bacterium]|jgi:dephospho-CoA kinase|nr:dephospho-CoA kinase [Actinomycetes bacterium]